MSNLTQLERTHSNHSAGRILGSNISRLPAELFRNFAYGFAQFLSEEKLGHLIEIAWSEKRIRENLKKYSKGS